MRTLARCCLAVFTAGFLACSGAAGPAGTAPGEPASTKPKAEPKTVEVKPFETEELKPRHQAVILGSKPDGKSSVIPLVGSEASVAVDAMWVRVGRGARKTEGGSSEVLLTTAPQNDGRVRVGMYEQFAGGMGPQWRAAVWISSFVASTVLGKDLTDFRFTAENTGYIDGASAGALMTAGFLASLTGEEVAADASMTGIVNPDGTVGPVGGIPHKFAASIKGGKKRVGYPVGQQFDFDMNQRRKVDLVKLARSAGAEAVEIEDVYQAYTLLTGKKLPVPIPVSVGEMALEESVESALQAKYNVWRKTLNDEWSTLTSLRNAGKLPAGLRALADRAAREASEAESLLHQGLMTAAYMRIVDAVVYAATAVAVYQVLDHARQGNIAAARSTLTGFQGTAQATEKALRQVGAMKPKTLGGHLQMLSAFQQGIKGWGFHQFGTDQMQIAQGSLKSLAGRPPATLASDVRAHEKLVHDVIPAVLAIARGVAATQMALEAIEIEGVQGHNYTCPMPNVRRLAESFSSAAAANIKYYESLFVKKAANQYRVPEEKAQIILMRQNPDYLVAFMAFQLRRLPVGVPAKLKSDWGKRSIPWNLGMLAGSILSYFKTSLLISKNYSLRVQINPFTGEPTKVGHQKAFNTMMQNAERKAREHARSALVATGQIPVQARLYYQNARTLRDSKHLADRIRALELYWEASVFSQVAAMLARNG